MNAPCNPIIRTLRIAFIYLHAAPNPVSKPLFHLKINTIPNSALIIPFNI